MNAALREHFRRALLRVLASNTTRYAVGPDTLRHFVKAEGFPEVTLDDVLLELQYLEGKGFAGKAYKAISPDNTTWRITDAGQMENEHG